MIHQEHVVLVRLDFASLRIVVTKESLPDRRGNYHAHESESCNYENMRRRELVNVLQEESIEFSDLPEDNKLTECHETHVSTRGIEPSDRCPTSRRELQYSPLEFARRALDISYADPFVLSHLEYRANL